MPEKMLKASPEQMNFANTLRWAYEIKYRAQISSMAALSITIAKWADLKKIKGAKKRLMAGLSFARLNEMEIL